MAEAKPVKGPMGRPPRGVKPQVENPGKIFVRIMKYVLKNYTPHCIIAVVSIFVSVLANVQGTMFMKTLIDSYIMPMLKASDPDFMRFSVWQSFISSVFWLRLPRTV